MSGDKKGFAEGSTKNQGITKLNWMGLFFAVFCWGLSFPLLKVVLADVEPITLAVIRTTMGVIPLVFYLIHRDGFEGFIKPLKQDPGIFVALGVAGISLPNIFQNFGMTMTSAHLSSIIQASGPIFTIILAVIILREPLGRNKVIGAAIAVTGTILLVTGGGLNLSDSSFLGNILIMLSAISYAVSSIMSKKILEKYDAFTVATLSMVLGTLILSIFIIFESPTEKIPAISFNSWMIILVLALLPGSFALLLWYKILRTTEVSRIILFIYLIPVFATAISYFWPGEVITIHTVLFSVLIVGGVVIAQYEEGSNNKRNKNAPVSSETVISENNI